MIRSADPVTDEVLAEYPALSRLQLEEVTSVPEQLEVGAVGINAMAGTEASVPFGGVKRSGIDRELGRYGLDGFSNNQMFRSPVTTGA